jgi:hypothetical protein
LSPATCVAGKVILSVELNLFALTLAAQRLDAETNMEHKQTKTVSDVDEGKMRRGEEKIVVVLVRFDLNGFSSCAFKRQCGARCERFLRLYLLR